MAATRAARRKPMPRSRRAAAAATFDPERLQALRALVARWSGVREGRMFGYPAFFIGPRMFACVYRDGVGLKLPAATAVEARGQPGVTDFRPHGKPPMREWIQLHPAGPGDLVRHRDLLVAAARYARRLTAGQPR